MFSKRPFMSLAPDHPAMQDIQNRISQQLISANSKLDQEIIQLENQLKSTTKQRQQNGVELFSKQQHLQQINDKLVDIQNKTDSAKLDRQDRSKKMTELLQNHEVVLSHHDDILNMLDESQQELKNKTEDLKLLELAELALKKSISNNTEEFNKSIKDVIKFQGDKIAQDYYVNNIIESRDVLAERIRRGNIEQKVIMDKIKHIKHHSKKSENEMNVIEMEKAHVIAHWNFCLKDLETKRQKLLLLSQNIGSIEASNNLTQKEICNLERQLQHSKKQLESSQTLLNRLKRDLRLASVEALALQDKSASAQANSNIVNNCIASEKRKAEELRSKIGLQQYNLQKLESHRSALDDKLTSSQKGYMNEFEKQEALKAEQKQAISELGHVKLRLNLENSKYIQLESSYTQLLVKSSDLDVELIQLKKSKPLILSRTKSKTAEFEQKEKLQISNNKDINHNLLLIDLLNQKISQNQRPIESQSPLELMIEKNHFEINLEESNHLDLQSEWIGVENQIIEQAGDTEDIQKALLQQKKDFETIDMRIHMLDQETIATQDKINVKSKLKSKLFFKLDKLNSSLYVSNVENTLALEKSQGLLGKLKEKVFIDELNILKQENVLESTNREKTALLNAMEDVDDDLSFWRMKIQGLNETRKLLNPVQGSKDLSDMKVQIHKLELELQTLIKQQQCHIKEMNVLVEKRQFPGKK
eukprot:NODE_777_length_4309_cov_0.224228.p1 type:complete len:702 gc:universal NODE_777_length_4309_cov_0.224228:748-2853(+)